MTPHRWAASSTSCGKSSSLAETPTQRRPTPRDSSTGHEDKLLKKIAEEAGEVIMAAKDADREHLRYEVGDLVYHLLVVMARWGLTPDDLAEELASRRT